MMLLRFLLAAPPAGGMRYRLTIQRLEDREAYPMAGTCFGDMRLAPYGYHEYDRFKEKLEMALRHCHMSRP